MINQPFAQADLAELTGVAIRPDGTVDDRPLPTADDIALAVEGMAECLVSSLAGTRLEDELDPLLWSLANLFQRQVNATERKHDDIIRALKKSIDEQDGSEVADVELQDLQTKAATLEEQQNAMECARDAAAECYAAHIGKAWLPATGSMTNRQTMTASAIQGARYVQAKRKKDRQLEAPEGKLICVLGDRETQEWERIWDYLDRVKAKHPDMIVAHGGDRQGCDRWVAKWAKAKGVVQVPYPPNFQKHGNRAGFMRNDDLLSADPYAVITFFGGNGVTKNLAQKARKQGVPVIEIA